MGEERMKEQKLNYGDIAMVEHFLIERGDMTRWSHWEERKPLFEKEFPEFIAAMKNLEIARRTLRAVINNMEEIVSARDNNY